MAVHGCKDRELVPSRRRGRALAQHVRNLGADALDVGEFRAWRPLAYRRCGCPAQQAAFHVVCKRADAALRKRHLHLDAVAAKRVVEKGARDAVMRYTEALLKNDIETLDKLWGEDLIFIDSRGRVQTKPQRMADIRSGANTFKAIELQDTFTKSSGNHVLLFTRGILRAQYGGKDTTGEYRI